MLILQRRAVLLEGDVGDLCWHSVANNHSNEAFNSHYVQILEKVHKGNNIIGELPTNLLRKAAWFFFWLQAFEQLGQGCISPSQGYFAGLVILCS